jgi:alpha-tubulin suppressor-like RCC1 family protein
MADGEGMTQWVSRAAAVFSALVLVVVPTTSNDRASAASIATASDVSIGYDHACAMSSGQIHCWGRNNNGQLGNAGTTDSSVPVQVTGGHTWASVDAGTGFTCAVTTGNAGYCWGLGVEGQLGDTNGVSSSSPVLVSGGYSWKSVSAGDNHACGVTTTDAGYCWGHNAVGQLGDGAFFGTLYAPSPVQGGHTWATISAGWRASCGLRTNGAAYCWGSNAYGQTGDDSNVDSYVPKLVNGGFTWTNISAGYRYACGVTSGAGYCWGDNGNENLGDGTVFTRDEPTLVLGGNTFTSVSAGYGATCGILSSTVVKCWGANGLGAVGDGTNTNRSTPVAVADGLLATKVQTGGGGACAQTTIGLVYCWGWNAYGTVGNGQTTNTNRPSGVVGFAILQDSTVVSVTVDPAFTFTVTGASSACNNEPSFSGTAGSATEVALGRLTTSSNVSGGQLLSVVSNAGGGFSVFTRGTQSTNNLRSTTPVHPWADVAAPYGSPAALGTGERFGYTFKDSTTLSSVVNPASAEFVRLDATDRAVMGSSTSLSGSGCISFTAQTSATTPAGRYAATVIYTAIPAF